MDDQGDRLSLLFEDGKERALLASAPGLVEVDGKSVSKESSARGVSPSEANLKLSKVRVSRIIKSVRLAIRDGLQVLKAEGAFPDDTLVDMQKGLSRITADYARFGGTQPVVVRKVTAKSARGLHDQFGVDALVSELCTRIEDCEPSDYEDRTRAYHKPQEASRAIKKTFGLLDKGTKIKDRDIEALVDLLTPADLKAARGWD